MSDAPQYGEPPAPRWQRELSRYQAAQSNSAHAALLDRATPLEQMIALATRHYQDWASAAAMAIGGRDMRDLKQMYQRLEQDVYVLSRTRQVGIDFKIDEDGLNKMVDRCLVKIQSERSMEQCSY